MGSKSDKDNTAELADMALKVLALESLVKILNEKLAEVMPKDDYKKFHENAPKLAFFDLFNNCPIPHLREFALDHFDEIVGDMEDNVEGADFS